MRTVTPNWKPVGPTRISGALKRMHEANPHAVCAISGLGRGNPDGLSIHHVYDRSDVWENCVFLTGSGTTGNHGAITANNELARTLLGEHIAEERPDIIAFVLSRAGEVAGRDWFRRRLFLDVP